MNRRIRLGASAALTATLIGLGASTANAANAEGWAWPDDFNQTFTVQAANPDTALAAARQQMEDAVDFGDFRGGGCNEVGYSAQWIRERGRVATGSATVYAYCWGGK